MAHVIPVAKILNRCGSIFLEVWYIVKNRPWWCLKDQGFCHQLDSVLTDDVHLIQSQWGHFLHLLIRGVKPFFGEYFSLGGLVALADWVGDSTVQKHPSTFLTVLLMPCLQLSSNDICSPWEPFVQGIHQGIGLIIYSSNAWHHQSLL